MKYLMNMMMKIGIKLSINNIIYSYSLQSLTTRSIIHKIMKKSMVKQEKNNTFIIAKRPMKNESIQIKFKNLSKLVKNFLRKST